MDNRKYIVVREYSWTDRRMLLQVLTRPCGIHSAIVEKTVNEQVDTRKRKRKCSILEVLSDEEIHTRLSNR